MTRPAPPPEPAVVEQPAEVVVVRTAPPAARVEVVPARPSASHVWIAGHWYWRGGNWVWIGGRYVVRARAGAVWVPAHWERRGGEWHYKPGHWK